MTPRREILIIQALHRSVALIASSLRPLAAKQIREALGCTSNSIWATVAELLALHPRTFAVGRRGGRTYAFRMKP